MKLWDCEKPDCERLVSSRGMYCCTPCNMADGNGPTGEKYEIHAHSDGCDERWAERLRPGLELSPGEVLMDAKPRRGAALDDVPWEEMTPEEQESERKLAIAYHQRRAEQLIARMIKPKDLLRGVY